MSAPVPFRADHVGSLLRPASLRDARAQAQRGELGASALRDIQQAAILEVVAKQESIGLQAITDGEFSRDWWHVDFLAGFDGVETYYGPASSGFGGVTEQPALLKVTGKIRRTKPIFVEHFKFLKSVTKRTPKMTIPAPAMLHHRAGRAAVSMDAYPDIAEMWADVSRGYAEEIADLSAAGCSYLQIDDTSHAMLCDPKFRDGIRKRGDDPDQLVYTYGNAINRALAKRPAGLSVTMHTCRGNFKNTWAASGGYDGVQWHHADGGEEFRGGAGGFEPLRFVPKNKKIVLGLVTTKTPELESKDALKRRIDEAAKYVPIENLCLSPQCGFSSTHHGNKITPEVQWKKLALVVEVAREVWGD